MNKLNPLNWKPGSVEALLAFIFLTYTIYYNATGNTTSATEYHILFWILATAGIIRKDLYNYNTKKENKHE